MKKYILWILIWIWCIFNFTNAQEYETYTLLWNSYIWYLDTTYQANWHYYRIDSNLNFHTIVWNNDYNVFFRDKYPANYIIDQFSRYNWKIYWIAVNSSWYNEYQWELKWCKQTEYIDNANINWVRWQNCWTFNISNDDFINEIWTVEYYTITTVWYATPITTNWRNMQLCFYNWTYYYCTTIWNDSWRYRSPVENSLWIEWTSISLIWINWWNSPFYNWWWNIIPSTTNNNYYCPTIKQVMANMWTQYNTGLCYNWTLKYENWTITTVQKKDIFTVFTDYNEYTQRISLYNENCTTPNTTNNCQNAFSGEFEKYSIIANAINNNTNPKKLWNYCNMWLNYDPNATTCVASWYIQEQPTEQEFINDIINWQYTKITNISTPNTWDTWNVLNSLLWTWQTREDIANRDILWQVEQIKEKLQTLFTNRNGVNGIIPDYILWLILLTLLLTVLLKK